VASRKNSSARLSMIHTALTIDGLKKRWWRNWWRPQCWPKCERRSNASRAQRPQTLSNFERTQWPSVRTNHGSSAGIRYRYLEYMQTAPSEPLRSSHRVLKVPTNTVHPCISPNRALPL